jgi:hypothetical protein
VPRKERFHDLTKYEELQRAVWGDARPKIGWGAQLDENGDLEFTF